MALKLEEFILDEKGLLNDVGLKLLAGLLHHLPEVHRGWWKEAFVPIVSKSVRVCVDLAVIDRHKVLLKWRKDDFWEGWECPGGSLGPGEDWEAAAFRLAEKEFGMKVDFVKEIGYFNNTDNPRAHDFSVLLWCEARSEPKEGRWFTDYPKGLIDAHQKYWPHIQKLL